MKNLKNITLEMSLKPFKETTDEAIEIVFQNAPPMTHGYAIQRLHGRIGIFLNFEQDLKNRNDHCKREKTKKGRENVIDHIQQHILFIRRN